MALAHPIVYALFGAKYADAPVFLALLAVNYLLTAFGQLSTLNLISGQGKTRFYLELAIVNTATGIVLAFLLVPTFGVVGLIITTIFDGVPGLWISLKWIRKHYDANVDWISSAKITASSVAAGGTAYFAISFLSLGNGLKLLIGLAVFFAVFLLVAIAIRVLRKWDIYNLRAMTSELGPLTKIINKILNLLEKMV
jgi:stage V sporulation protein B